MKKNVLLVCFSMLLLVFTCPLMVNGQETRGAIRGLVIDPNGSPVPGAKVVVKDVARGTEVSTTTNNEGFYQANYLLSGKYIITVEAVGFKTLQRENVVIEIGNTLQVDLPLEIGGAAETVTVTTDIVQLNTENASISQTIDSQRMSELPLPKGDPYKLMGTATGVAHTGSQRLDRPFEPTHIVGYAVDGTRGNRSDLTIDGISSTSTANANEVIASYVPPSDIVQEFKVQTATFDAQFGNTEGGVTSISIKSGTNDFHGTAYLFNEPNALTALDAFGKARNQPKPENQSNRFGGSINGPVRFPWLYNGKDKTFFLFGYEEIRDSRPRFDATNIWTPTAALRNGDFSAYLSGNCSPPTCNPTIIYDPLTRVNTGTSTSPNWTGTAFPGNIIPADRISPVARAILQYYAQPKTGGLNGNIFDSSLAEKTDPYRNWTFRIDQNITGNNRMFVRGSWYDRNSIYNDYLASPATGVNFIFASRQGVIDDVHIFNSTTVLNVRYGYNRFIRNQDQELDARGFDLAQLGFPSSYNSIIPVDIRRFPRFDFSGSVSAPVGTGFGNEFRPTTTHTPAATLNKTFDKHSTKFGVELRIYREDSRFVSNDQTGQFVFNNTYTRQATNTTTPDTDGLQAFASFLLGLPATTNIVRRADYSEYSKTWGFFAQDDWKINRKLTVNLGLRYEYEQALVERQNKSVSGFDPNYVQTAVQTAARARLTTNPVTGYNGQPIDPNTFNVRGGLIFADENNPNLYNTPKDTFLPRFGIAYQWDDKTVIRGGIGWFAGFLGQRRGDVIQPGFTRTTQVALTALPNGSPIPQNIVAGIVNTQVLEPVGAGQGLETGLGTSISFFNQNPKVSKQVRYQIGIQRELPWGVLGEAIFVGNNGYDIEISRNINALPLQYLNTDNFRSPAMVANNTLLTAQIANPFNGISQFAGTGFINQNIARSQLLRPFPAFGDITTTNNDGKSWYYSGQFSLSKRLSQGFNAQMSYTWSKWIQQTEYLNAADETPVKVISDQDVPHRLSFNFTYRLPFGRGGAFYSDANRWVDAVIGGWQFSGVYAFQTGFPLGFGDLFYWGGNIGTSNSNTLRGFDISGIRSYYDFPQYLPANTPNPTQAQINAAITAANTAATPVNHLRTFPFRFTDVRRDNINNIDFNFAKDIRFNENMRLRLTLELFNAFNEPYFPAAQTAPNSANFATITAANQDNYARRGQIGIKFIF